MPTWLQVGIVGKAHGLRGHFFVSQRDDVLPIPVGQSVYLDKPAHGQLYTLEESRIQSKRPIAKLAKVDSRTAVEALTGKPIWVDRALIKVEDEGEYLWGDLIGKAVVDDTGCALGTITAVDNYGASDIVTIASDGGREVVIALVPAYFVMDFEPQDPVIRLIVPASTFEDLWRD